MIALLGQDSKGAVLTGVVLARGILNSEVDARMFVQTDDEVCWFSNHPQVLRRVQLVGYEHGLCA